jgi:hypothetical protein
MCQPFEIYTNILRVFFICLIVRSLGSPEESHFLAPRRAGIGHGPARDGIGNASGREGIDWIGSTNRLCVGGGSMDSI